MTDKFKNMVQGIYGWKVKDGKFEEIEDKEVIVNDQ